jgi:hypothetical protein
MMQFLQTLKKRNAALYYFGWGCIISTLVSLVLIFATDKQVLGINAWIKPMKFFLSAAIFCWTMGWLMTHLDEKRKVAAFSWVVIVVFAFETIYIAYQAGRGQLSHFNISSKFNGMMFGMMGIAITVMTLWTAYIGYLFFAKKFPALPAAYVWGIRLGILFFVIFAFEGGVMASKLAHTVGGSNSGPGLPVINWSTKYGDLRIAHFFGMHALQILPLLSYYRIRSTKAVIIFAAVYFLAVSLLLAQAMLGAPLIRL